MYSEETPYLKTGLVSEKIIKRLRDIVRDLYEIDPLDFIRQRLAYTCFNRDLCIIYGKTRDSGDLKIIYEDNWVALWIKKTLVPSISLVREIYSHTGIRAALVVSTTGVKAFLYGNDILRESVVEIIPPDRGLYTVIDSEDMDIIGFVKWNDVEKVYENIYDIGIFLRLLG